MFGHSEYIIMITTKQKIKYGKNVIIQTKREKNRSCAYQVLSATFILSRAKHNIDRPIFISLPRLSAN